MGEKGLKRPKNRVFGLLRKIESLVFASNDLKQGGHYGWEGWEIISFSNLVAGNLDFSPTMVDDSSAFLATLKK